MLSTKFDSIRAGFHRFELKGSVFVRIGPDGERNPVKRELRSRSNGLVYRCG